MHFNLQRTYNHVGWEDFAAGNASAADEFPQNNRSSSWNKTFFLSIIFCNEQQLTKDMLYEY